MQNEFNLQIFGGRGSSSSGANSMNAMQLPVAPTAAAAVAANNSVFKSFDPNDYHDLYNGKQYFLNQNLTIDQQMAAINYLSDTPERGSLYSMSQNMNQNLAEGKPLTANQQFVYDNMISSMHNVGYNIKLTRYDHANQINALLANAGLTKGYENYSAAQLSKALVGTKFTENKLLSTSYNDFKNAGSSANTFKSRAIKITYETKASAQGMMPGNGPGGALGEMVLAPKQTQSIKSVSFTNTKARAKGTQNFNLPQLHVVIEVG